MIGQPPRWTREHSCGRVFLFPPRGPDIAGVRYDEHRAPRLALDEILREQTAGRVALESASEWTRMTTVEGEHAATIRLTGSFDGRAAQISLGVVLFDDAYALLNAYCFAEDAYAEHHANLVELTRGTMHFLGVRRRRFAYARPPGWTSRACGSVTQHVSGTSTITVWPALPCRTISADAFAAQLGIRVTDDQLSGSLRIVSLAEGARHACIFECDRYIYPLHLENPTGDTAHVEAFQKLVASVELVPRPAIDERALSTLACWAI